ncbi:MAG: hypothetical protein QW165_01265 [Candidatus Woesearchaeota archaeon]
MKALTTLLFCVMFVLSSVMVSAQSHVTPVAIEQAEIDGTEIEPFGVNQLDLERDQEFELRLELMAWEEAKDVEIRAFISGYEYNDVKSIADQIGPFDFRENVTYVKKLHISLPDDVDVDDYQLRVIISDRNGWELVYNYQLQVNTKRHLLKIDDVYLSAHSVQAGQAVTAVVRLENQGQKDEKDVKVAVSIPGLGVSGVDYIDEIENDEEEETEEIFLRTPRCAEPGVYDVKIDAWYNKGHSKVSGESKLTVLENPACAPEPAPVVVVQPAQNATSAEAPASSASAGKLRSALEIILLVLVALLVIVGLIIGFSRMRGEE